MSFDGLGEDIGMGSAESEASVQERLSELKRAAAQNRGAKKKMKKDEKKAHDQEETIALFLIHWIQSAQNDDRLIDAINGVLRDGHSPYLIACSLSILFVIPDHHSMIENEKNGLPIHIKMLTEAIPLSSWLNALEQSCYISPHRTLKPIQLCPDSLSRLFEILFVLHKERFPQILLPVDLVETSNRITEKFEAKIQAYILSASIEG
jgi:hypothetical protein